MPALRLHAFAATARVGLTQALEPMPDNFATQCFTASLRDRIGLATFGEPQVCPTCGKPLEFSRSWQRAIFASQLLALVVCAISPIQGHGTLTIGILIVVLTVLQLVLWSFAPVRHQSSTEIKRRNRFYLLCALTVLTFALCYYLWVNAHGL